MKKKLFPLIGGVAVLALLLGVYAYKTGIGSGSSGESEPTTEETVSEVAYVNSGKYTLCDKSEQDIRDIVITSQDNTLKIKIADGSYSVEGYEDVKLSMSNTASVASTFLGLYSDDKITDGDRKKYGLDNPLATGSASFGDGSSVTLALGSLTADKRYYYMESSECEGIYLIDAVVGGRLLYTINDLTDKNITAIKPDYVTYIEVTNAEGKELLMYYDKDKSNANTNLANNGLATLTMEKPLEGASVYPYNLSDTILSTCKSLRLDEVAQAKPDDLSQFGLDKPSLTIRLKDNEGSLELKTGDAADDGSVYVMVDNRPSVFTMDKNLIKPFESYAIADFVEKFVALHMRADIHTVTMDGEFGSFTLDFKAEGDNKITTGENGNIKDNRLALLNGKQFEGEDFTDFYELLAGLTFDEITQHSEKSGEPAVKLTYTLLDGQEQTTAFYLYNDNFYCVGMEGEYDMLVSRQSVKQIADRAAALSK